ESGNEIGHFQDPVVHGLRTWFFAQRLEKRIHLCPCDAQILELSQQVHHFSQGPIRPDSRFQFTLPVGSHGSFSHSAIVRPGPIRPWVAEAALGGGGIPFIPWTTHLPSSLSLVPPAPIFAPRPIAGWHHRHTASAAHRGSPAWPACLSPPRQGNRPPG